MPIVCTATSANIDPYLHIHLYLHYCNIQNHYGIKHYKTNIFYDHIIYSFYIILILFFFWGAYSSFKKIGVKHVIEPKQDGSLGWGLLKSFYIIYI